MLNEKRTIPYEFRVFEMDGWAWLYDESERMYLCTSTPHVYAEPVYPMSGEYDDPYPEEALLRASEVESMESFSVEIDPDDADPEMDRAEAWNAAREEANANHRV